MPDADKPVVACPVCSGPLTAERKSWVCEVGHRFDFAALAQGQAEACVRALWYALRSLEDRAISSKFAAASYQQNGQDRQADHLLEQRADDLAMIDQLHLLLQELQGDGQARTGQPAPVSHDEPDDQGSHS